MKRPLLPALCSVNQVWLTEPASDAADARENLVRITSTTAAAATAKATTHALNGIALKDISIWRSYPGWTTRCPALTTESASAVPGGHSVGMPVQFRPLLESDLRVGGPASPTREPERALAPAVSPYG